MADRKTVTVTLTGAEASALWTLADMAGDQADTGLSTPTFRAGRRAMRKLADASIASPPTRREPS
jgi:hypothetical protein